MRDQGDPELDPRFAEVAGALDEAAREEREDLAEVSGGPDPPGSAALEAAAAAAWRALDRARRRARWMRGLSLSAAAAAVVLFVALARGPRDAGGRGPGGELLGGGEVQLVEPREPVRTWGAIEWTGGERPYELRVLDTVSGESLLGPVRLDVPRYLPAAEETARWPAAIEVEIRWRRPDGTPEKAAFQARLTR